LPSLIKNFYYVIFILVKTILCYRMQINIGLKIYEKFGLPII